MSQPLISASGGPITVIEIPADWTLNISMVSRKPYFQAAKARWNEKHFFFMSSVGDGLGDETMKEMKYGTAVALSSEDYGTMLEISFSHMDQQPSLKTQILSIAKPSGVPQDTPDYITFIIFVQDSPMQTSSRNLQYGDMIGTVHLTKAARPTSSRFEAVYEAASHVLNEFQSSASTRDPAYDPPPPNGSETATNFGLPVGILGAGVAGLYTAMILDSLAIKYEIIEGSNRHGGRLYTHRFRELSGNPREPSAPYQYFDVGAMRYPDIPFMKRGFDLVHDKLGIGAKLIPVIMSNDHTFLHFNGHGITKSQYNQINEGGSSVDAFGIGAEQNDDGSIPEEYLREGHKKLYERALHPLRQYFVDAPFPEAFKQLMKHDMYSVRDYMSLVLAYPNPVIRWIETMEWRTGMFDASLTETVLASLSFEDPLTQNKYGTDVKWYCFDGGSQVLADAMLQATAVKPQYYKRVTAIKEAKEDNYQTLSVTIDSRDDPNLFGGNPISTHRYSNIISTLPLSVLRTLDLDEIYLTSGQRSGLRELQYSPSIKVGIQFKSAWWEKLGIVGGQSYTDRPSRSIVYPSHGPGLANSQRSNVLLASYNGMQDSLRLAALMRGRGTQQEDLLLDIIMKDLSVIHNKPLQELWDEFVDYHAWDWYSHSFALGAFAWFGPGQFSDIYPHITMPASTTQRFFFAGDATSACHGWIVGALNSVWRAVRHMLIAHPELNPNPGEDILQKFIDIWGPSGEWPDEDAFTRQARMGGGNSGEEARAV